MKTFFPPELLLNYILQMCDNLPIPPAAVSLSGSLVLLACACLVGPLPAAVLPLEPTVASVTAAMATGGVGFACAVVSTFARAQRGATEEMGLPGDIDTYLVVSGEKKKKSKQQPRVARRDKTSIPATKKEMKFISLLFPNLIPNSNLKHSMYLDCQNLLERTQPPTVACKMEAQS